MNKNEEVIVNDGHGTHEISPVPESVVSRESRVTVRLQHEHALQCSPGEILQPSSTTVTLQQVRSHS
jgi:hypothetical protein